MTKHVVFALAFIAIGCTLAIIFVFYGRIDTIYAAGYTENRYNQLAEGTDKRDVLLALGEPLHRARASAGSSIVPWCEAWVYSQQGADKRANFYARIIQFDCEGKVTGKESYLYVD